MSNGQPHIYDVLVNQATGSRIGIVGSPSSTAEIVIDILQISEQSRILGQLVYLVVPQEGCYLAVLGQISQVETKNRWHEDLVFRGIIKRRGELPHLSDRADVRTATIAVQAAFQFDPNDDNQLVTEGVLAVSPSTGIAVHRVRNEVLDILLHRHSDHIIYLGKVYGTDVNMPFWLKHFDSGEGGAGEAYHIGVFGRTGSGKSGLAAYLLLGYARHRQMGILFIDPQGQFSADRDLPFKLHDTLQREYKRQVEIFGLNRGVRFSHQPALFAKLLQRMDFYRHIGVRSSSNKDYAEEIVAARVKSILKEFECELSNPPEGLLLHVLTALRNDEVALNSIYSDKTARKRLEDTLDRVINNQDDLDELTQYWQPILDLFMDEDSRGNRRTSLDAIIGGVSGEADGDRPIIFLDISGRGTQFSDDDGMKALILREITRTLAWQGEQAFRNNRKSNCLVAVDEAHRFARSISSRGEDDEAQKLSDSFVRGVRETRKYGLGYLFITQSLASLHPEILGQLRIKYFGHGLNMGQELEKLKEEVGGDKNAVSLYTSFADPASATTRQFPFMVTGPASPLSFTGSPLFFQSFTDFFGQFIPANEREG